MKSQKNLKLNTCNVQFILQIALFNYNFDVENFDFWSSNVNFLLQWVLTFTVWIKNWSFQHQFWYLVSVIWTINWTLHAFNFNWKDKRRAVGTRETETKKPQKRRKMKSARSWRPIQQGTTYYQRFISSWSYFQKFYCNYCAVFYCEYLSCSVFWKS